MSANQRVPPRPRAVASTPIARSDDKPSRRRPAAAGRSFHQPSGRAPTTFAASTISSGCRGTTSRNAGHESAKPGCRVSSSTFSMGTHSRAWLSKSEMYGSNGVVTSAITVVYDQKPRSSTLVARGARASGGESASSSDSRSAPSTADSNCCSAPPGIPQVPPKWLHGMRCCKSTPRCGSIASRPAAPKRPQYRSPVGAVTQVSPVRLGSFARRMAPVFGSISLTVLLSMMTPAPTSRVRVWD